MFVSSPIELLDARIGEREAIRVTLPLKQTRFLEIIHLSFIFR